MRSATTTAGLALIAALCAPTPIHGQAADDFGRSHSARALDAAVDSLVGAEAVDRGAPAVAVAIVADGNVVVQRAWGTADVSTGRAATAATPFNVASVTKPFTSALVMQLVDEGALELDDPVIRHLPSLPYRYSDITVRQLLTHTSGIARDLRLDNIDDPDRATYEARLDTATASSAPGTRFEYSNTGYTVLGWLVSAVEDEPLDGVMQRRLFEPMGMAQARYRVPPAEDPLRAAPHAVEDGEPRVTDYVTGGFGSGGISMSVADAAAFGIALQRGDFLPAGLADSVWTPAVLGDGSGVDVQMFGEPASYGFGWFLARYSGRPMMTHGGGIDGYSANLYHFPEERLTIVVLANTKGRDDGRAPVDPLARQLADLCLHNNACRPEPQESRLRSAITAANRAFSRAYLAGDTAAIRRMYLSDALALPPSARAVAGARGISALFASPRASRRLEHALYTERLVQAGAGLVELGTWYDRWEHTGGEQGAATGRYVLTWVRDGDEWKIAADAWVPARR